MIQALHGCAAPIVSAHRQRLNDQMPHFLDTLPFDWTRPEARELRDYLAGIYFREEPVVEFAVEAGVSPATIAWSQPMQAVWHDLITKARNQNKLRALLEQVAARDDAVALRLHELMATVPIVEAPATPYATPSWRGFDDRAELERQIFDDPTLLDIAFLQRGVELAPAVARLLVTLPSGTYYGTAFRIGDDLMLTNHHVLFDSPADGGNDVPASAVEAWLHYELDFAGRQRLHQAVECRPETIVGERTHDWSVVRTADPMPTDIPVVRLAGADPVNVNDRVYIIQHPKGGVKKIGLHHNIVRYVDADIIQYWTDTEPGSSGSPVFNEQWQVVALHHRSLAVKAAGGGEYRNQGRQISRVVEGLRTAGVL